MIRDLRFAITYKLLGWAVMMAPEGYPRITLASDLRQWLLNSEKS